jgi:CheY-like chemotaxis protein
MKKLNCVLLVDDNESDNFIHKRVLEKSEITKSIAVALNGQEALDFLKTKINKPQSEDAYCQPDLIFLDINMPVMDGWEFLDEYHKLENDQKGKVVFIMLTTSLNPVDRSRAEQMITGGCFQFKPLTQEMINTIMKIHFPEYL